MYEKIFIPTETDLAYVAGIIDGEGCISMTNMVSGAHPRKHYSMSVYVGNTNRSLMLWLELYFGGRFSFQQRTGNRKNYYGWRLYSSEANLFLKSILPYLKLKRRQAEIAIEFQKNIKVGRNQSNPYTDKEVAVKEAQVILMHSLNQKGVANASRI